ncbi:tetratricopeptide repeat protein [candidate division KSB1 bacterium]|nr:tetratricopeptide repeat protein [candidate division KSB1 bacterium]RQW06821.1 MAG: tetratricopeptide repeat protein [candidate division KSB1 bacterium]
MQVRNATKFLLVLAVLFLLGVVLAQSTEQKKAQYDEKVRALKDVSVKMSAQGITTDEYNKLKEQYESLNGEILKLQDELNSDQAYTKKMNDAKLAYNEGNTLFKQGQYDEAVAAYDKSLALDPSNSNAYQGKGLTLAKQRKYDEAVAAYKKAVEADPTNYAAFAAMGKAHYDNKDFSNAVEAYQQAVDINPQRETNIYMLALSYNRIKDTKNAIKYFTMATQVKPDYEKAFNSLGEAYMTDGQVENAINAFEMAISIDEKYDEAYYRLAAANNKTGRYQEALDAAQNCLKVTKKFKGAANFEAGTAAKKLGRLDEAKKYFEAAASDRQWRKSAEYELDLLSKGL